MRRYMLHELWVQGCRAGTRLATRQRQTSIDIGSASCYLRRLGLVGDAASPGDTLFEGALGVPRGHAVCARCGAVNPIFCTGLGELAKQHPEALIQSHISESHDAVAFSLVMHPEADGRDARLFDEAGLLTSKVRLHLNKG